MGAWKMKWLLVLLVARIWLACSESTTNQTEYVDKEQSENIRSTRQLDVDTEQSENIRSTRQLDVDTEQSENIRSTRQIDFIECCPCPGSERSLADAVGAASGDCPCRRDSEGSSSVLFPSLRNAASALRPLQPKQEAKPLLHPEVDLASNVLQTLRDATDEEYKEALARNAARAAARASDTDIITDSQENGKSLVTIVINPKANENDDDTLSEASHIQEARCIPSTLGSKRNRLGLQRSSNLRDILHLPKQRHLGILHKNILDMNNGASNVEERFVIPSDGSKSILYTSSKPISKSFLKPRDNVGLLKSRKIYYKPIKMENNTEEDSFKTSRSNISKVPNWRMKDLKQNTEETKTETRHLTKQSIPHIRANEELAEDVKNSKKQISETLFPKLPNLKLKSGIDNILDKLQNTSTSSKLKEHLIPRLKPEGNDDSFTSATNKQYLFSNRASVIPNLKTSLTMPENLSTTKTPLILYNLLKSRDGELLSPGEILESIRKPLINIPDFRMPTALKNLEDIVTPFKKFKENSVSPLFRDAIKTKPNRNEQQVSASDVVIQINNAGAETNIHVIPKNKKVTTEILDSVLNPTDIEDSLIAHTNNIENEGITDQFPYSENSVDNGNSDSTNKNVGISGNKEEPKSSLPGKASPSDLDFEANNDLISFTSKEKLADDCEHGILSPDLVSDPTEEVTTIVPLKWNTNNRTSNSLESSEVEDSNEGKILSPFNKLSSLKEKILKKLGRNNDDSGQLNTLRSQYVSEEKKESSSKPVEEEKNNSSENNTEDFSQSPSDKPDISSKEQIYFHDLQKMSDSILESSNKQEQIANSLESSEICDNIKTKSSEENPEEQISETLNIESEENSGKHNVNFNTASIKTEQANNSHESELIPTVNTCTAETTKKIKTFITQEMSAQASNTNEHLAQPLSEIFNGNGMKSLLRQSIVQPSSLTDIFTRPIPNIFESLHLNPQVPTLDDIRSRIANILGTNASEDDDEISSADFDPSIDSTNMKSVISPEASTSSVTPLKPLKDINLNIFQMTPVQAVHKGSHSQPFPGLNLNSFKAKLSVPQSLAIEPLKLESAMGDKSSLFGARFSVGSDNQRKSQKPNQRIRSSLINRSKLNLFGNPLENVQKFDELRSTMRNNMQNFLKSAQPTFLGESLHSSPLSSLSDEFKSRTGNTMSTLHKNLRPKLLGESLTRPDQILEIVSQKHEDFQDKLKGLHYDLTDRLSSLHDSVLDRTSLFTPFHRDATPFQARLRSSKPSYQKSYTATRTTNTKTIRPTKAPRISNQSRNDRKELRKVKTFRMPTAASSPVEKKMEAPRSFTNIFKPRTAHDDVSDHSNNNIFKRPKKPLFRNFKPLTESKITISFSTTPRPTTEAPKIVTTAKAVAKPKSDFKTRAADWLAKRKKKKDLKSLDSNVSPSESVKGKTIPLSKHSNLKTDTFKKHSGNIQDTKQKSDEKLATGKLNLRLAKDRLSLPKSPLLDLKGPLLPKVTSSNLFANTEITNILESPLKTGIFSFKPLEKMNKSNGLDMSLSPTQNVEKAVALVEPLKENVPYKCKLMCTREQK